MFSHPVTQSYDLTDATGEILIMLGVAFVLGYLLRLVTHECGVGYVSDAPPIIPDDLKVIEGIGPKIEGLLNAAGVHTYEQLSKARLTMLESVLKDAGPRFRMHDPSTWGEQAALADAEEWEKLEKLKDRLVGGKK